MKLRKGDTVIVISGGNSKTHADKGKVGEILKVNEKDNTVVVQGVNVVVKHVKPTQNKPEGSIETFEAPIDASNVAYYDSKNKKAVKIGFKFIDGKKVRINKLTGQPVEKKVKVAKEEVKEETPEVKEAAPAKKAPAAKTVAKAPAKKAPATKSATKAPAKKESK